MSNLDFSMVGREPSAFHDFVPSWSPPFDEETMAPANSNMPKLYSEIPEFRSKTTVREDIRELAELLASGQSVKVQIPSVHRALAKHVRNLSERRVKSMFFGEVERLWDDEKDAIRRELAAVKNAKARKAFAEAAAALMRGLSAAGHPLSADQTSALHNMVRAAA
jgi:hypothetical protein